MKFLKRIKMLFLFILNVMLLNAWGEAGNSNSNVVSADLSSQNTQEIMLLTMNEGLNPSGIQAQLSIAKKAGKAAFLVVTGNGVVDTDKALTIAKGANDKYKNAVVLELNRDDSGNAELVNQWGLQRAPLPLILVISPRGHATGGLLLNQATAEILAELVPSPKMDEVYDALTEKKASFLVVSDKSSNDREAVLQSCKAAVERMKDQAIIIEMDANNPKEAKFLSQLNLQVSAGTATIVINAHGQTTGMFEGPVESNQLVLAGYRVVQGGGCGPTCGSSH